MARPTNRSLGLSNHWHRLFAGGGRLAALLLAAVGVAFAVAALPDLPSAAGNGWAWAVRVRLWLGADPNKGDPTGGMTPLEHAARCGDLEVTRLLVRAGGDVRAVGRDGLRPLDHARSEVVGELVRLGASTDDRDASGWTPLHRAAFRHDVPLAAALLDAGAEVDCRDSRGLTPLHASVLGGRHARTLVAMLLARGADPRASGADGLTAGGLAMSQGYAELADALRRAEADTRGPGP